MKSLQKYPVSCYFLSRKAALSFKTTIVLFICLFSSSSYCYAQTTQIFYVSPGGSDQHQGTEANPFRSIIKAKEAAKAFKVNYPSHAITMVLGEGTYYLEQALVFEADESGSESAPYIIRAAKNEKAVLSGGKSLDLRWKTYRGNILVAKVSGKTQFTSLFINGEKQIMARYPNYREDVYPFGGFSEDALAKDKVNSWRDPKGGYIHALHRGRWGGMHYQITGRQADGSLTYEGGWQNNRKSEMHPKMRFVENIFEELDSPGEWYHNVDKGLLYYYPENGISEQEIQQVEVAVLENLITLQGDSQNPVHDIIFEGLVFTQTAPTFMKTEEPLMRSDWTIYRNGALLMDGTENCVVKNSVFTGLGGNAVFVSNYNWETKITGNLIEKIGASGISFVGNSEAVRSPSFNYHEFVEEAAMDTIPGPKTENYPSNAIVFDNLIRNIGLIEKQVAGVQIQVAMDLHISHNTVYNVPRSGINIGDGAWGGHIIEYNDVFNTVMETGDHGAFNSWGRDRFWHPDRGTMNDLVEKHPEWIKLDAVKTTIIRNNRFHCDHGWDIDLDDGSSNYEIYNNLCLSGGIKLREGFYRTVYNNITLNNGFHPHVWFKESHDVFTRNIVMTSHQQIRVNHWGDKVDENFFTAEEDLVRSQKFSVEASGEFGYPEFIDPDKGNFGVKDHSPAISKLGFQNFRMDNFGVLSTNLKEQSASPTFPDLLMEMETGTDDLYSWHGYQLKNMATLGEQSAAGLNEITGVLVKVVPLEAGEKEAGFLQVGDVILACFNDPVKGFLSLRKAEKGNMWKGSVALKVWRNQQEITIVLAD
jgi:hypothetical protein